MKTRRLPTDNGIEEMLKSFYAAAKADPKYMPLDENDNPRVQLYKTLCEINDEEEKTIQKVKQLIINIKESGRDLNYYSQSGHTPISIACVRNKPAILKLLIEENADPHFTHGNIDPVLRLAPVPNLMRATEEHSIKCMQILLDNGVSASEADESLHLHKTPLHVAAEGGQIEEVKLLLIANAAVNSDNTYFSTPLAIAAKAGKADVVNLLIDNEANVNAKDSSRRLPLHRASSGGHIDVIKSLLAAKADINAKNWRKETPLILAIYGYYKTRSNSHALAIQHLMSLAAEPSLTSNPVTTDIFETKSTFKQLAEHTRPWCLPKKLENSLVACEINKGAPDISFKLCMLISEYLEPDFVAQEILAEERSQRIRESTKPILFISVMTAIAVSMGFVLASKFGSERQKRNLISSGSSLGYEALKTGLITGISLFAGFKGRVIADEYGVLDKIKKTFKR